MVDTSASAADRVDLWRRAIPLVQRDLAIESADGLRMVGLALADLGIRLPLIAVLDFAQARFYVSGTREHEAAAAALRQATADYLEALRSACEAALGPGGAAASVASVRLLARQPIEGLRAALEAADAIAADAEALVHLARAAAREVEALPPTA